MLKKEVMFIVILVFILNIPNTLAAIGVSPGSYEVDFQPGLKRTFSFEFIADSDMKLKIYVEGDLANYTKLSKTFLDGPGFVDVTVKLPENIELPGTHKLFIGGAQVASEDDTGFGIVGTVRGVIKIKVPYPGQYLDTQFSVESVNLGEKVPAHLTISNLGKETVNSYSYVEVNDSINKLDSFNLGSNLLESTQTAEISKMLDTQNYVPGYYSAKCIVNYGENKVEKTARFRIGEFYVNISNYTRIVERNKINKFEVRAESFWKHPIENVYAEVSVINTSIRFNTPSITVDGFKESVLSGYFDTSGIEGDSFDANITLHYAGRVTEKIVTLRFKNEANYVMIGLIIAAIALALIALMVYMKMGRNKKNERRK